MTVFDEISPEEISDAVGRLPALRRRAERRRRRRRIPVIGALAVVIGVAVGLIATSGASPAPRQNVEVSPLGPAPGPRPAGRSAGAPIPASDIVALQMFDLDDGIGLASYPAAPVCSGGCAGRDAGRPSPDYLVATHDGGRTWRVTGRLPSAVHGDLGIELHLAFSTPTTGDVLVIQLGLVLFTDDAGRRWGTVETPGQPDAISLDGTDLWVVSDVCASAGTPPRDCTSHLLTYRPGQPTAESDLPILGKGRFATLLDRLGPASGVFVDNSSPNAGEVGPHERLVVTHDGGRQLATVDNPCGGLVPDGLVAPAPGRWVLECQQDQGMNSGIIRLDTTRNGGRTWTLTADAGQVGAQLGTIRGLAGDLTLAGDDRTLLLVGQVAGVEISTDGGRDWTQVDIQTGGNGSDLAVAGATSAWLPVTGVGLYHTPDAATWSKLR